MTKKPTIIPLDNGVSTVDAEYVRPWMAASHLLVDEGRAAFVDVGTSHSTPVLLAALDEVGVPREQVDYVIVTHVHLDHAGGAGTLMRALPGARLVAHPRGARHMIDPTKLIEGSVAVYGEEELQRLYGEIAATPAERVIEAPDGHELRLGGRTLSFFDAPGHAKHHFCVVDPASDGVFTGDAFGLSYRELDTGRGPWIFPTTTPVHFDPEAMHATVDRIVATGARWAYLTHFGRVGDLPARAAALHRLIGQIVDIARAADGHDDRHERLTGGMWDLFLADVRAHGCELPVDEIRRVLWMDIELNAQGLEVWLDK